LVAPFAEADERLTEIQSVKERLEEQKQIANQWKFCATLVPVIVVYLLSPHTGLLLHQALAAAA